MKIFNCSKCGALAFYENVKCLTCGSTLGYVPSIGAISAIEEKEGGKWQALHSELGGQLFKMCANRINHRVCNWMVPAEGQGDFCKSCNLDLMIPDLKLEGNVDRWLKLENAKRRVLYTIYKLGLPTEGLPAENRPGLRFQFVGTVEGAPPPVTGHLNGVITVHIAEADDAEREQRRVSLHEPYRTLLGHMRHETAHFFWDRLIKDSQWTAQFRKLFGDENLNYGTALQQYYAQGAPADWPNRYVSAYASSHPWEDWAETWAHYFHIIDMIETAGNFGVVLEPRHTAAKSMIANPALVDGSDFEAVLKHWFPLTFLLNSLNRGMGLSDGYPFVLSTPAIDKMRFIHEVIRASGKKSAPA